MDTDVVLAPGTISFDAFLAQPGHGGRLRHVVVTDNGRILGVLRVNTALRRAPREAHPGLSLADVASRDFTLVREEDVVSDVIRRMWRRKAFMALVLRGHGVPHSQHVVGVISKEHVADSVADSVAVYPGWE